MTGPQNLRRAVLFLLPAAFAVNLTRAQEPGVPSRMPPGDHPGDHPEDARLPNGKKQRDAILKADYEQNLKDAQDLAARAKDFEMELEKSDQFVLSLGLLKELDEIDRIAKRIKGRMRRY